MKNPKHSNFVDRWWYSVELHHGGNSPCVLKSSGRLVVGHGYGNSADVLNNFCVAGDILKHYDPVSALFILCKDKKLLNFYTFFVISVTVLTHIKLFEFASIAEGTILLFLHQ